MNQSEPTLENYFANLPCIRPVHVGHSYESAQSWECECVYSCETVREVAAVNQTMARRADLGEDIQATLQSAVSGAINKVLSRIEQLPRSRKEERDDESDAGSEDDFQPERLKRLVTGLS